MRIWVVFTCYMDWYGTPSEENYTAWIAAFHPRYKLQMMLNLPVHLCSMESTWSRTWMLFFDVVWHRYHDTCVCVWLGEWHGAIQCKQPESEDWLDADQWTCQSMPKWLVAAVSNRLWKSLDLSTPVWSYPQKGGFDRSKMQKAWTWHEHGTNKQTSDVSAIDASTSQSCTAKSLQK